MEQQTLYENFRRAVTQARLAAGLTQQEIASRLTKPQSFVSKYESGERRLDVVEFILVCNAIGVSPESIIRQVGGCHASA
jgi:transcriptional regulator with XRE-family HTH domain